MKYRKLFEFLVEEVQRIGDAGRGVIIVRKTPAKEVADEFEAFLTEMGSKDFKKESIQNYPHVFIFHKEGSSVHFVIGTHEEGWKGDYGMTHQDAVVCIY